MWTFCLFSAAAWQPLGGRLIDAYGARRCMCCLILPYSACIYALGTVGGAHALWSLALFFFVVRAGGPGWLNTMLVKIFNAWFERKRGRASMILVFWCAAPGPQPGRLHGLRGLRGCAGRVGCTGCAARACPHS